MRVSHILLQVVHEIQGWQSLCLKYLFTIAWLPHHAKSLDARSLWGVVIAWLASSLLDTASGKAAIISLCPILTSPSWNFFSQFLYRQTQFIILEIFTRVEVWTSDIDYLRASIHPSTFASGKRKNSNHLRFSPGSSPLYLKKKSHQYDGGILACCAGIA